MQPLTRYTRPLVTIACLIAGNALLAFLVAAFIMPFGIIMGGTTGIGIVLESFWPSLDVALVVLVLNMALLLLGLVVLGRKFFVTTVASSIMYPVALGVMERIPGIESLTDDPVLAAIFAGCLMGIALGLVMRVGSSTGGMDVVALVLNHWFHLPLAALVYVTDFVVMGGQALFCNSQQILLGLLVLVLETILLDKTMLLGKSQIQLFVVSDQAEVIRETLLWKAEVGVTMLMLETGFRNTQGKGVLCVIPRRKLYDVTELVCSIDPEAFITISQINEVRGNGFTRERIALPVDQSGVTH
jgi:uncharacterized membrane-anchored protein YitT (DUF2179 family)